MELKKVWMSPDTKKKSKYGYRAVGGILGIVLLMVLLLCGGGYMELKKVWMSPDTKKKSKYGYRAVGGILGIVLLMVLLLCGGTLLSLSLGINKKASSLILLTAVSALGIGLAVLLGRRSIRDATIFFLTENDRLWVMDARGLSNHGNGFLGFAVGTMETQAFLRRQGRQPFIPNLTENDRLWVMDARGLSNHGNGFLGFAVGTMETQAFLRRQGRQPFIPNRADEILKVLNIKENRSHYAVRCQVRHPDTHVTRCTYLLIKGDPDEDMLLRGLERRKTWENAWEPDGNWNLLYILLGGLAFAACVTMCVLSHPAVAVMSGELYFPCMGASLAAFCVFLYFIIRQRTTQSDARCVIRIRM